VHAHKDEDLSRRDDLWSWLYMLTELLEGEEVEPVDPDVVYSAENAGQRWAGWRGAGC
jgi:hypothetical protein